MEFQFSYFKSWKMMLWKCCTQYASKFGKLSSGHRTGKGQFSFQSKRKAMPKNAQTTAQLHSSHMLVNSPSSKLSHTQNSPSQAEQYCWTIRELWTSRCSSWFLKRQRNQRSNCQHPLDHRKAREFQKKSISALLTMPKPCGKFWKRWEYQTTWPASWETYMQVRKQQLELDMKQQTGSK